MSFKISWDTAGAIALAEVLAENKHISHLDLRDNDVRVAGLMGLQLAHRMNHSLLSMDTPKFYKVDQVLYIVCYWAECLPDRCCDDLL